MTFTGVLSGVSVSHVDASVDEIEMACRDDLRGFVNGLLCRDGVEEAFALQTCNRAEAYVVTDGAAEGRRALTAFAPEVRDGAVVQLDHEESLRHLMRVAAGLESLVLGEDQILGQFRTAVEDARAVGGIGPTLDRALSKAIHVGERARSETSINEGAVSLGSAAVELAAETTDLSSATALVVGAGEMGTLAARAFAAADVEGLIVANRTLPHAEHVAAEVPVDARAVGLQSVGEVVTATDVVVTATGCPDPVLDASTFTDSGETAVVDIAQPRDVDPEVESLPAVDVWDLDDLTAVTDQTRSQRRAAAASVEAMVDEELDRLLTTYKRRRADEAIGTMYERAERLKERELEQAFATLEANGDLTPEQREAVTSLADSLVGQLLAAPTKSLRDAAEEDDWTTIHTAMQLFDPEFDTPPASPPTGTSPEGVPEGQPSDSHAGLQDELSSE